MPGIKDSKIAVVCSTYRNPDKPSLTRLYGIASLIDQIRHQQFSGQASVVIVDDSPEMHPFVEGLGGALGSSLMYFHVPERNNPPQEIRKRFQYATGFLPSDDALQNDPVWINKIKEATQWQTFLPFDYEFAKTAKIDMPGQMLSARPTIGMKKNFGCAAYTEATGGLPDTFVYVDDDDLRSAEYLDIVQKGIAGHSFARVTKTFCHNISADPAHRAWGEIDFKLQKDINGNWAIPSDVMDGDAYKYESGILIQRPVHDLYSRNLMLAWPVISHDGALHNYTGDTWYRGAQQFGGFFPTSFSEDIITFKRMSSLSGFSAAKIEVDQSPFIRCSDGRNASDFYCTRPLKEEDIPAWCQEALSPLYRATDASLPIEAHDDILFRMGRAYARTGALDLSLIGETSPSRPAFITGSKRGLAGGPV